jgi:hypothetical protein
MEKKQGLIDGIGVGKNETVKIKLASFWKLVRSLKVLSIVQLPYKCMIMEQDCYGWRARTRIVYKYFAKIKVNFDT